MTEQDKLYLAAFSSFLKSLGDDARALADAVASDLDEGARRPLVGALNYLFKSLDLIDDGIEGLGFLDDAFVLRIAARRAGSDAGEKVNKLGDDAALVSEFLGDLSPRLEKFVDGLMDSTVRGRSVSGILEDEGMREELVGDVRGWASRYSAPHLAAEERNLAKLLAFLSAKLPA